MLDIIPFLHSFFPLLIIGLSLYWDVHTSSDFSTTDFVPFNELSPLFQNATCRDFLGYMSVHVATSISIWVTLEMSPCEYSHWSHHKYIYWLAQSSFSTKYTRSWSWLVPQQQLVQDGIGSVSKLASASASDLMDCALDCDTALKLTNFFGLSQN